MLCRRNGAPTGGIARALVNNPAIILARTYRQPRLPEENEIMALFRSSPPDGNAIVLVTHEHDIAEYAHRIHISDGVVTKTKRRAGNISSQ